MIGSSHDFLPQCRFLFEMIVKEKEKCGEIQMPKIYFKEILHFKINF
jgi:hypothetical protein